MEQILIRLALKMLMSRGGREAIKTGVGVAATGLLLLVLIPVILLSVPWLLLGASINSGLPEAQAVAVLAREQIAYVEHLCQTVTGVELDSWVEHSRVQLAFRGIPEENIAISIPDGADRRIKVNEAIILWNVEFGSETVDGRIKEILDCFIDKSIAETSITLENGSIVRYATIKASIRSFEDVLISRSLDEQQMSIARIMLAISKESHQLQTGQWLGNDQLYTGGDRSFSDAQTPVIYYHQRDSRWANTAYAGESIGLAGCGPTAAAIVISSLLQRTITPAEIADWSENNGYAAYNNGSYNSLIPAVMQHYGLEVSSGAEPAVLEKALAEGKLAVAIMGPGSFTPSGHFIVLRGMDASGNILVADPVSVERSERSWSTETIFAESRKGSGSGGPIWIVAQAE